ncbi:zinc finger CCCH domain-containing protein 3 isoform X2 [Malania oleifera]|uniref:zinc finger CCCH domain-containing protein 3 isoform X2 n=1 Tax=Malania oleifera TaxID=397392 RepID=UPI0025ADA561|nr:zinc finger CCCH domain-containing protein 3 isoform X2 [Malania oleifera]
MPLGKYYCDYCDKQFQDTPSARKRHLQGLQHQRSKALWFDSFKDPYQTYPESFTKGVCNRFIRTFSGTSVTDNIQSPVPGNQLVGGSGNVVRESIGISWGNLPPSLKPPPEGGYPPLPFLDWG